MKILLCHNYYQQPGGEDAVFADEAGLLERHGHDVERLTVHNDAILNSKKWVLALATFWNRTLAGEIEQRIRSQRIELVHFHNTFPLISPAAYRAARRGGAAVVQTLHNYRLVCPAATLFRDGGVCEECLGKRLAWPAVAHGCYRESRATSAVVAGMLAGHRALGTWSSNVDQYIALTEFARQKFIAGGLPAAKLSVKPNFVDPVPPPGAGDGHYALFVGRLSPEKGIACLLDAWRRLGSQLPLKIAGQGPLAGAVETAAASQAGITFLGSRSRAEIDDLMARARCVILPSIWYEGLPKTLLEALAHGTPAIASRLGAMAEVIDHGRTGWLFAPGNAAALAEQALQCGAAISLNAMRANARAEFLARYTAEPNYECLLNIYDEALRARETYRHATPTGKGDMMQMLPAGSPSQSVASLAPTRVELVWPPKVDIFGVQVSVADYDQAIGSILRAAAQRASAVVSCQAVHGIIESSDDENLRAKVNTFALLTADGQPVRWAVNLLHRAGMRERVYGPELMWRLCAAASEAGVSIYLYGATTEVLQLLTTRLRAAFAGLKIAGSYAPPFRPLTPGEDRQVVDAINQSGAGLVFLGIGCPKQDHFAFDHVREIAAVQICVGAAFDFHAGVKRTAPAWMQRRGLEWVFRLSQEPRRLWRRYLKTNSRFLWKLAIAWFRARRRGAAPAESDAVAPRKLSPQLGLELDVAMQGEIDSSNGFGRQDDRAQ